MLPHPPQLFDPVALRRIPAGDELRRLRQRLERDFKVVPPRDVPKRAALTSKKPPLRLGVIHLGQKICRAIRSTQRQSAFIKNLPVWIVRKKRVDERTHRKRDVKIRSAGIQMLPHRIDAEDRWRDRLARDGQRRPGVDRESDDQRRAEKGFDVGAPGNARDAVGREDREHGRVSDREAADAVAIEHQPGCNREWRERRGVVQHRSIARANRSHDRDRDEE